MDPNAISSEVMEKLKACKTAEELVALAKSEGYELSDAELEQMSGGSWHCTTHEFDNPICANCGSTDVMITQIYRGGSISYQYECRICGNKWKATRL